MGDEEPAAPETGSRRPSQAGAGERRGSKMDDMMKAMDERRKSVTPADGAPAAKTPDPDSAAAPSKTPEPVKEEPEPGKDDTGKDKGGDSARKSPPAGDPGSTPQPSYMAKLEEFGIKSGGTGGGTGSDTYRSAEEILQKYRNKWSQEARMSPRTPGRSDMGKWNAPYSDRMEPMGGGYGSLPRYGSPRGGGSFPPPPPIGAHRPRPGRGGQDSSNAPMSRFPDRGYSTYKPPRPLAAPQPFYPSLARSPSPNREVNQPSAFSVATSLSDQLRKENEMLKHQIMSQEKEITVLRQEVDTSRRHTPVFIPEMMRGGSGGGGVGGGGSGLKLDPYSQDLLTSAMNRPMSPDPVVVKAKTMLRELDRNLTLQPPIPGGAPPHMASPRPPYSRGGHVMTENMHSKFSSPPPTANFRSQTPPASSRVPVEDKLIGRYGGEDNSFLDGGRGGGKAHPMITEIRERRLRRENPLAPPPRSRTLPAYRPPSPGGPHYTPPPMPPKRQALHDSDTDLYRRSSPPPQPAKRQPLYDSDTDLYRRSSPPPQPAKRQPLYDSDNDLYRKRNSSDSYLPRSSGGRVQMVRPGSPICDVACQANPTRERGIGPNNRGNYRPEREQPADYGGYERDRSPPRYHDYDAPPPPPTHRDRERDRDRYHDRGMSPPPQPSGRGDPDRQRAGQQRQPYPEKPPRGGVVSLDEFHWKTRELLERQRQISERIMQQFEQLELSLPSFGGGGSPRGGPASGPQRSGGGGKMGGPDCRPPPPAEDWYRDRPPMWGDSNEGSGPPRDQSYHRQGQKAQPPPPPGRYGGDYEENQWQMGY